MLLADPDQSALLSAIDLELHLPKHHHVLGLSLSLAHNHHPILQLLLAPVILLGHQLPELNLAAILALAKHLAELLLPTELLERLEPVHLVLLHLATVTPYSHLQLIHPPTPCEVDGPAADCHPHRPTLVALLSHSIQGSSLQWETDELTCLLHSRRKCLQQFPCEEHLICGPFS